MSIVGPTFSQQIRRRHEGSSDHLEVVRYPTGAYMCTRRQVTAEQAKAFNAGFDIVFEDTLAKRPIRPEFEDKARIFAASPHQSFETDSPKAAFDFLGGDEIAERMLLECDNQLSREALRE